MVVNSNVAAGLLAFLDAKGVKLVVRGIHLRAAAPRGVLTGPLKVLIRSQRAELVHQLQLRTPCTRCGAGTFVDVVIHGGRSRRRDCAVCGLTKGFPVWGPTAVTRVPPRGEYRNN